MAEAGRRGGDRVERLAWLVERLPRQRYDDRVEHAGEWRAAERDAAEKRLGVGDRRRPGEDGDGGELAREVLERPVAHRPGEGVDEPTQRGTGESCKRIRRAGYPRWRPISRGWSSTMETPVTAVRLARAAAILPARAPVGESDGASSDGAGGAEEIASAAHAPSSAQAPPRSEVSAAVTQTTRSASRSEP